MSSTTTKQYTPTTTARPTWREREAQKERQQREAVARAAEQQQQKKIAKTEENFPTTMKPTNKMLVHDGPPGKFAELAAKMQAAKEIERELENYRKATSDRERSVIRDTVIFLRNRSTRDQDYYESEEEALERENMSYEEEVEEESLDEKFPPHGKRGTYTAPDAEGWRLVTHKTRKQPQELTEAQLVQKYRDQFFGGDADEDEDHNVDLSERDQRRQFY